MPAPRRIAVATFCLLMMAARAAADVPVVEDPNPGPPNACPVIPCHLKMREYTTLQKDNGNQYRLPPGRFLDESTWVLVDDEMKRLQDQETRLGAENQSLRTSIKNDWKPGWLILTTAVVLGFAAGIGTYYYFEHR